MLHNSSYFLLLCYNIPFRFVYTLACRDFWCREFKGLIKYDCYLPAECYRAVGSGAAGESWAASFFLIFCRLAPHERGLAFELRWLALFHTKKAEPVYTTIDSICVTILGDFELPHVFEAAAMTEKGDRFPTPAIGDKPHQPRSFCFPQRKFGKTLVVKRSFQWQWIERSSWLHYYKERDIAFCFACVSAYQNILLISAYCLKRHTLLLVTLTGRTQLPSLPSTKEADVT